MYERIFSSLQEVIKLISFCASDYVNVKCLTFRVGFVSLLYSNNNVFLTKRKAGFCVPCCLQNHSHNINDAPSLTDRHSGNLNKPFLFFVVFDFTI